MTTIPRDGTLLRIFIGERDTWQGRPLAEAIVELARQQGLAGATCLKGFLGFGARSVLHTVKILRLSEDLPIVIEIVDRREAIERFVPQLDAMIHDGLVTLEPVEVLVYRSRSEGPSSSSP